MAIILRPGYNSTDLQTPSAGIRKTGSRRSGRSFAKYLVCRLELQKGWCFMPANLSISYVRRIRRLITRGPISSRNTAPTAKTRSKCGGTLICGASKPSARSAASALCSVMSASIPEKLEAVTTIRKQASVVTTHGLYQMTEAILTNAASVQQYAGRGEGCGRFFPWRWQRGLRREGI